MFLVLTIDLLVTAVLIRLALKCGFEQALPFAAFACVLLPTSAIVEFGPVTLPPQRVIILLLAILYLVRPLKSRRIGRMSLVVLICLNVAWDLLSAANSVMPDMSVKKVLSQIGDYYVLYFLYAKGTSKVSTIHNILLAMVAAIFGCSIFGIIETYGEWTIMSIFPAVPHMFGGGGTLAFDSDRGFRSASTFDHPILFGAVLAMGIIIAIYLLCVTRDRKQKVFLWISLMLMFVNIYKTSSRGPWLALAIGLALLGLLGYRQVRNPLLAIGVLVVGVLTIRPGVWDTIAGLYRNSLDPNTTVYASYQYRYALRDAAIAALARDSNRALWGYGMESFYSLRLKGDFGGREHQFLSCDSAWIASMVETGYIGLVLFALLLFAPVVMAFRDYYEIRGSDRYLSLMLLINFVLYYFMMMSVAMYSWGQNGYMLWIMIALAAIYRSVRKASKRKTTLNAAEELVAEDYWTTADNPVGAAGPDTEPVYSNAPRSHVARVLPS